MRGLVGEGIESGAVIAVKMHYFVLQKMSVLTKVTLEQRPSQW